MELTPQLYLSFWGYMNMLNNMLKLTQKRLKELLCYDPETGIFTWKERVLSRKRKSEKSGQIAGNINKTTGYRRIGIDGESYIAPRLAFLYMKGYFPEHEVDHKNRIRLDDRWENLRHVSRQCNTRNKSIYKNNKSGIAGVSWNKNRKRWAATITTFCKTLNIGRFKSKIDAVKTRWEAEKKYNFQNCNTTSSAYLYIKNRGDYAI